MASPVRILARATGLALVGPIVCGPAACGPVEEIDGPGTGRGVLLITIDGLRADRLSGLGHHRPTTPVLDGLMAEGVTFTQAQAAAPLLLPAHVPLFTGCAPNTARWILPRDGFENTMEDQWRVSAEAPCLAAEFLRAGFATAAFVDHPHLGKAFRFDRGFQRFDVTEPVPGEIRETSGIEVVGDRFGRWVNSLHRSKPWFAYLHLHDLERTWRFPDPQWESYFRPEEGQDHIPPVGQTDSVFFAVPRSRWRGGNRTIGEFEARYDGHLRRLDGQLAALLHDLEAHGRLSNTTVVVVGTHGVQLGEGGLYLRSGRYTDADVHVPWIISSPRLALREEGSGGEPRDERVRDSGDGAAASGRTIDQVVSVLDVAPTLLGLIGLDVPQGMHGTNHGPLLRGEAPVEGPGYAFVTCGLLEGGAVVGPRWTMEFPEPWRVFDDSLLRGWYGDGLERGIDSRRFYFYDRERDPYWPVPEDEWPAEAQAMADAGARWAENVDLTRRVLHHRGIFHEPVTAEMIQRLRAEGFLGEEY